MNTAFIILNELFVHFSSFHFNADLLIELLCWLAFLDYSFSRALNIKQTENNKANGKNKLRDECRKSPPMALFPTPFHMNCCLQRGILKVTISKLLLDHSVHLLS